MSGVSSIDAELTQARDPATAPERLAALTRSRRREVRDAVVGNPNAPAAVIERLGPGHPEALAGNPLLAWLAVEDADFLRGIGPRARRRLLTRIDSGALWWATRHGDDDDRLAVLANPALPSSAVAWLVEHGSLVVAEAAADHVNFDGARGAAVDDNSPATLPVAAVDADALDQFFALGAAPTWLLPAAGASGETWLRRRAAEHPHCPPATLRTLLLDDEPAVRTAARSHPAVPPAAAALADAMGATTGPSRDAGPAGAAPAVAVADLGPQDLAWLRASEAGRSWLGARSDLPADLLISMVGSESWRERAAVAAGPSLTGTTALPLAIDPDPDVRAALAANPRCPTLLLALLAGDDEAKVVEALAGRAEPAPSGPGVLAHDLLDSLAAFAGRGPLMAARNLGASAGQLDRWAASGEWRVRQACAEHRLASVPTLLRLAADADYDVRHAAAANPALGTDEIESMAGDPHVLVRTAVARRVTAPAVLDRLASSADAEVLAALVANPAVTGTLLARLVDASAGAVAPAVVAAVARRRDVPTAVLTALAGRREPDVMAALAGRDDLPDDAWARLFEPCPEHGALVRAVVHGTVLHGAVLHGDAITADLADADIRHLGAVVTGAPWVLELLERRRLIPTGLFAQLTAHPDWRLRERIALDPRCPVDVLATLAEDSDYDVRKAVAAHPSTADADVIALVADANQAVRLAVTSRVELAEVLVERLVEDESDDVRTAALAHRSCPPDLAAAHAALAAGGEVGPGVLWAASNGSLDARVAVARHRYCTEDLLDALAGDGQWRVREAVAARAGTPGHLLARLATDTDRDVRRAVAANPSVPLAVLLRLFDDTDDAVRRVVTTHPSLPTDRRERALARLLVPASRSASVASRAAVAWCPDTPRYLRRRRRFWQSPDWPVRYAVATNVATEPDLLRLLATDANRFVRAAAAGRLTDTEHEGP